MSRVFNCNVLLIVSAIMLTSPFCPFATAQRASQSIKNTKSATAKQTIPSSVPRILSQIAAPPLKVLIDPGHGGEDYGAIYSDTKESHLILELAHKLKEQLSRNPKLQLELTRTSDTTLTLQDRTSLANNYDILISLHGNSSPIATASGAEIYYEGELSPDKEKDYLFYRQKIVQAENGTSDEAQSWQTQTIIDDLKRRGKRSLSLSIGQNLAAQWSSNLGSVRLKPAQFYILQQSSVPSLLIEVGFLSNAKDLEKLKSAPFQRQLASEVEKALLSYKDSMDKKGEGF